MNQRLTREQKVAHRFLSSYALIGDRLESAVDCIARAEARKASISASISALSMGGSDPGNKMLNAIVSLDRAVDDLQALADTFAGQYRDVEELVSEVQRSDPQAGRALRLVYINGLEAKDVADAEHFAKKTVYGQLKQGLDLAYSILCGGGDLDG